jgi:protein-disulfide isomerase
VIARRTLITGAAVTAAATLGLPAIRWVRDALTPLPDFIPLGDPAGFRKVAGGPVSLAGNAFVGMDTDGDADTALRAAQAEVRANLCKSLFGTNTFNKQTVAIASFSDYYCPYCRIQTKRLAELEKESDKGIQVSWHELPLLGPASLLAARAALAAKQQGAYLRFHENLLGSAFQPTPSFLRALADGIGLDADQLIAQMSSAAVQQELNRSTALARLFGIIGTPSMIIGRTVVHGRISESVLLKIIGNERQTNWAALC